jgi:ketosteroid isomerase-like protein
MKTVLLLPVLICCLCDLYAQNQPLEAIIRHLEQKEVQAILERDTITLQKIWDKDYVVNNPDNVIVSAGKTTLDRPVLKRARTVFTRDIERITIRQNVAFAMGSETIIPAGDQPQSGQRVKRRYTNIWEKQADGWKLVARHANVICQPN